MRRRPIYILQKYNILRFTRSSRLNMIHRENNLNWRKDFWGVPGEQMYILGAQFWESRRAKIFAYTVPRNRRQTDKGLKDIGNFCRILSSFAQFSSPSTRKSGMALTISFPPFGPLFVLFFSFLSSSSFSSKSPIPHLVQQHSSFHLIHQQKLQHHHPHSINNHNLSHSQLFHVLIRYC